MRGQKDVRCVGTVVIGVSGVIVLLWEGPRGRREGRRGGGGGGWGGGGGGGQEERERMEGRQTVHQT